MWLVAATGGGEELGLETPDKELKRRVPERVLLVHGLLSLHPSTTQGTEDTGRKSPSLAVNIPLK